MEIKAISQFEGIASICTKCGKDGRYTLDGSYIRGDRLDIPQDEIAFRIWAQNQDLKFKDTQLRRMWKEKQK